MQKITPSLWYDRNCEEAINYYVSVFNSNPAKKLESRIVSLKRYPNEGLEGPMKGMEGQVLTAIFELEGMRYMALDGGPIFKPNEAISFLIECESQDEVDHFWTKLTDGGDPKAQQCGWLKDKFGFSWQVFPKRMGELLSDPDPVKAGRVMQAMLQMKKIQIATLEEAYNG